MALDIGALFNGTSGRTAGFPVTDYPQQNFYGPTSLQPKGGNAEQAHAITPTQRQHMIIVIAVVAVAGYVLWHWNYNR